jgi:hypothetical protein
MSDATVPEPFAALEADWRPEPVELSEPALPGPARALAELFDQPPPAGSCW